MWFEASTFLYNLLHLIDLMTVVTYSSGNYVFNQISSKLASDWLGSILLEKNDNLVRIQYFVKHSIDWTNSLKVSKLNCESANKVPQKVVKMAVNMTTTKENLSFVKSLSALFYVSKIFGIIPYSVTEFYRNKKLSTSILGNVYSILMLVIYINLYHFVATSPYFDGTAFTSGENSCWLFCKNRSDSNQILLPLHAMIEPFIILLILIFVFSRSANDNHWPMPFIHGTAIDDNWYYSHIDKSTPFNALHSAIRNDWSKIVQREYSCEI